MDFNEMKEQFTNPEDVTDMFTDEDVNANKGIAAVSTIPILFWIPLVAGNSPFAKFYANQGLTLLILSVVLNVIVAILSAILGLIPIIGAVIATLIGLLANVINLGGWLFVFISALQGKARPLPLIGKLVNVIK
jgi:uncharacterized membrane protein